MSERRKPSIFWLTIGPRGGGKTVLLTAHICKKLIIGHYTGEKVWSNFPVGFWHRDVRDGKWVYLKPLPLNMEALYTFSKEMFWGWVFVDEIDLWYDRQEWAQITQKMISAVLQQIRKRRLSFAASIQDIKWLNARGQFQTDVITRCRDLSFTPYGRKNDMELGEMISLAWIDKSGMKTGYTYEEDGKVRKQTFFAKPLWNKYDTDYQFDVLASKVRYRLKVPTKEIDLTRPDGVDMIEPKSAKISRDLALLSDLVHELRGKGVVRIRKTELLDQAEGMGLVTSRFKVGRILESLGVYTRGTGNMEYGLDRVEVEVKT